LYLAPKSFYFPAFFDKCLYGRAKSFKYRASKIIPKLECTALTAGVTKQCGDPFGLK